MTTESKTDVTGAPPVRSSAWLAGQPEPFYNKDGIVIYCGDNRTILPMLECHDLLLTDPPYGIAKDRYRKNTGGKQSATGSAPKRLFCNTLDEWDVDRPTREQIALALSKSKSAIIWGGNYLADMLPPSMGWLFWDKLNDGKSFANGELAWTSEKKALRVKRHRWDGMLRDGENAALYHPTQKPLELMTWCMSDTDAKTVLDPWMGSGTTLVAAKSLGMRATGIEINQEYCEAAVARLAQGVLWPANARTERPAMTKG